MPVMSTAQAREVLAQRAGSRPPNSAGATAPGGLTVPEGSFTPSWMKPNSAYQSPQQPRGGGGYLPPGATARGGAMQGGAMQGGGLPISAAQSAASGFGAGFGGIYGPDSGGGNFSPSMSGGDPPQWMGEGTGRPPGATDAQWEAGIAKAINSGQIPAGMTQEQWNAVIVQEMKNAPVNDIFGGRGTPQTGLIGSENALRAGASGAMSEYEAGGKYSTDAINQYFNQGQGQLNQGIAGYNPYVESGRNASNLQADLSGANGPGAQAAAFENFKASPGQEFLQQQQEQALTRNAAATGGLSSGALQSALQDQAMQRAQADYGNYYDRLGGLSDRGITGVAGQAGLYGQAGQMSGAQGQNLADIETRMREGRANLLRETSRDIGTQRFNVGQSISAAIGNTTSALASYQDQGGRGLSDLQGGFADKLAGLLESTGGQLSADQQNMMNMLVQSGLVTSEQLSNAILARGGKASTDAGFDWSPAVAAVGGALADTWDNNSTGQLSFTDTPNSQVA